MHRFDEPAVRDRQARQPVRRRRRRRHHRRLRARPTPATRCQRFGGIVAVNRPVPAALAEALAPVFTEVVVAPVVRRRRARRCWRPRRTCGCCRRRRRRRRPLDLRSDRRRPARAGARPGRRSTARRGGWSPRRSPTDGAVGRPRVRLAGVRGGELATPSCSPRTGQAVGIGAGQQNRVDSARIAAERAAGRAAGGVCASDAFFPFRDGLDAAADAGVARRHPARRQRPRRRGRSPPPTSTASPWSSPASATSATDARRPLAVGTRVAVALAPRASPRRDVRGEAAVEPSVAWLRMARIADLLAAGGRSPSSSSRRRPTAPSSRLGRTIAELEPLGPSFVSVTYGAGGSTRAAHPRGRHLGPPGDRRSRRWPTSPARATPGPRSPRSSTTTAAAGIENILALGGDPPARPGRRPAERLHTTPAELVDDVGRAGRFSIGVAAHPEVHPRSPDRDDRPAPPRRQAAPGRLRHHPVLLRGRALRPPGRRAGRARRRQAGHPGHHAGHQRRPGRAHGRAQSGAAFPAWLAERLERASTTRTRSAAIGVEVATELCAELLDAGAPGLHFYTLNRSHGDPRDLRQPRPSRRRADRRRRRGDRHRRARPEDRARPRPDST